MKRTYIAADFGGGSGRIIAAYIDESADGKTLVMKEIHRFGNRPVKIGEYIYWDFPALFADLKEGLRKAAQNCEGIVSIGIDTWGVDFGLIDSKGNLVGNPVCYRDDHTNGWTEQFTKQFDVAKHYAEAGIQILQINTLFRLWQMAKTGDPKLKIAEKLLFMPDLFCFFLTGKEGNEYTIASTSELLDAKTRDWNYSLIEALEINPHLFGKIIFPGEFRGTISQDIACETGLNSDVKVVAVGSHDTASAVFAAADEYNTSSCAFLSSGTWSLLGVVTENPVLNEKARLANFTNEGAVGGKIRFLTNITGLWILQRLKTEWDKEDENLRWMDLIEEARVAKETSIIDVDDPVFNDPENMAEHIKEYCMAHKLEGPQTRGEFVRCICRSLAHRYAMAIDSLNAILPNKISMLKIFGGGSNNSLLNEMTAESTGLKIEIGPTEATAIGNILVQAIADGMINDKSEITRIIENGNC